jgi:hypothetical protein
MLEGPFMTGPFLLTTRFAKRNLAYAPFNSPVGGRFSRVAEKLKARRSFPLSSLMSYRKRQIHSHSYAIMTRRMVLGRPVLRPSINWYQCVYRQRRLFADVTQDTRSV